MDSLTISIAFLMGLTGSLHCAGMCSPIVWIMPFQAFSGIRKAIAVGMYHLGRISVYASLALVLHSFSGLFDPRWQQYISIALGGILLITGMFAFIPNEKFRFKLPWTGKVQQMLGKVIGKNGLSAITLAGMLNGLLPCGLVYMALSASMTVSGTLQTVGFMFLFGAGTLPMLVSVTLLKTKLALFRTQQFRKLVPLVVMFFGCLFVVRGMNLGIPYLSPKVEMAQHSIHASCCQKNRVFNKKN